MFSEIWAGFMQADIVERIVTSLLPCGKRSPRCGRLARSRRSGMSAVRSLSGVKRTWARHRGTVAHDPCETSAVKICCDDNGMVADRMSLWGAHEAARVHYDSWRRSGGMAAGGARAAAGAHKAHRRPDVRLRNRS